MVEPATPVTPKSESRYRDFLHWVPMIVVAVAFVLVWEGVAQFLIGDEFVFPGPLKVADALARMWEDASLGRAVAVTLSRLAVGFLISLVLGAILAILMVRFVTFGKGIQPYILGLQTFPSIAWVPIGIVWFGLSDTTLLFVTIIGSLFAVSISFADALRTVPPVYLQAARTMGTDGLDLIFRVTVPATLPHLISAAKVGWSVAWRSLVGAEIIFATVGLGRLVEQGKEFFRTDQVMGVMVVILVLGILVDRWVFAWTQERASRRRGLISHR